MHPLHEPGPPDRLTAIVVDSLLDPSRTSALSLRDWDALLRALRRNRLLGSFALRLGEAGLLERAPGKAVTLMTHARIAAESARTSLRFEVDRMSRALRNYDGPLVLLKGAAYEFHDLPPSVGRVSGDVDVMVPRSRIDEVERQLVNGGWRSSADDPYDQRYYREWTHEVPALQHPLRGTSIDLHHTVAPPTGRTHPDSAALFAAAVSTRSPRLKVLAPADMTVHATIHLFNDEVAFPLRDLFDLHLLLSRFSGLAGFWDDLIVRAEMHGAGRALHYMLNSTARVFGTAVPADTLERAARFAPSPPTGVLLRRLFETRFSAGFAGSRTVGARIAGSALQIRAHWLRMPPALLARHLLVKSVRRVKDRFTATKAATEPANG